MQRRLRDAIELSHGSRPWLFESPLAGTKHDARHLGQQVGPAARDLPQLGDRRAGLGLGQLTPLGVPPGSPQSSTDGASQQPPCPDHRPLACRTAARPNAWSLKPWHGQTVPGPRHRQGHIQQARKEAAS
jgi:hypothetical protein